MLYIILLFVFVVVVVYLMMLMRRQKEKMSEIKIQIDQLQAQHDRLQKERDQLQERMNHLEEQREHLQMQTDQAFRSADEIEKIYDEIWNHANTIHLYSSSVRCIDTECLYIRCLLTDICDDTNFRDQGIQRVIFMTGTFAHYLSPPCFSNALITFTIFKDAGHFSTQRPHPTQEYIPLLFAG